MCCITNKYKEKKQQKHSSLTKPIQLYCIEAIYFMAVRHLKYAVEFHVCCISFSTPNKKVKLSMCLTTGVQSL
jgi:hypothetical protein